MKFLTRAFRPDFVLSVLGLFLSLHAFGQGPLTPPGAPAPTMKTLQQVEPRTHITSLPYVITASGSYYLAANLNGGGATVGLFVQASGVTIDLQGFSILNCTVGITAGAGVKNVTVKNGHVRDCAGAGIDLAAVSGCRLEGVTVSDNGGPGASVGAGSVITLSQASANAGAGFLLGDGSEIFSSVARSNSQSGIVLGGNGQARENTAIGNGGGGAQAGIVLAGDSNRAEDNACNRNNGFGLRVIGTNNFVLRNNACGNTTVDFSVGAGNHYGQILISPGAAFANSNAWANFSCSTQPGFCQVAADCNDANACTSDACVNNVCVFNAVTCNDNNSCTTDSCNPASGCVFTNATNGTACNDNSACTTNDVCTAGVCGGSAISCPNDANVCTTAACHPVTGCFQQNNTASCDDGNLCEKLFRRQSLHDGQLQPGHGRLLLHEQFRRVQRWKSLHHGRFLLRRRLPDRPRDAGVQRQQFLHHGLLQPRRGLRLLQRRQRHDVQRRQRLHHR
jgi:Right handed beta helix region